MNFRTTLFLAVFMPVAYSQFITFKDGKIGVNFFGYTAEAGLGGLLTGNAAHGGLSASAGTPFGQRAAAGLGGSVDEQGRPRGGGFAAATVGNGVGASAALGGNVNELGGSGGLGSEAHGLGYSAKKVELTSFPQQPRIPQGTKNVDIQQLPALEQRASFDDASATAVQPLPYAGRRRRYKTNTKYIQRGDGGRDKVKTVIEEDSSEESREIKNKISVRRRTRSTKENASASSSTSNPLATNPNFFNDIFNIPISVLSAVNQFLNNGFAARNGTMTKMRRSSN